MWYLPTTEAEGGAGGHGRVSAIKPIGGVVEVSHPHAKAGSKSGRKIRAQNYLLEPSKGEK